MSSYISASWYAVQPHEMFWWFFWYVRSDSRLMSTINFFSRVLFCCLPFCYYPSPLHQWSNNSIIWTNGDLNPCRIIEEKFKQALFFFQIPLVPTFLNHILEIRIPQMFPHPEVQRLNLTRESSFKGTPLDWALPNVFEDLDFLSHYRAANRIKPLVARSFKIRCLTARVSYCNSQYDSQLRRGLMSPQFRAIEISWCAWCYVSEKMQYCIP